jgi:NAD(P)-dependent dehydrogenase (short-subunit alcohol dehydrogenase family)
MIEQALLAGDVREAVTVLRSRGVRVNAIAPGPTRTDGVRVEWGEGIEEIGRATALGRTAGAHKIAETIVFVPHRGPAT